MAAELKSEQPSTCAKRREGKAGVKTRRRKARATRATDSSSRAALEADGPCFGRHTFDFFHARPAWKRLDAGGYSSKILSALARKKPNARRARQHDCDLRCWTGARCVSYASVNRAAMRGSTSLRLRRCETQRPSLRPRSSGMGLWPTPSASISTKRTAASRTSHLSGNILTGLTIRLRFWVL